MVYPLRCRKIAFCYLRQSFIHVCFHLCAVLVRVVNQRFQRVATIYKSWHCAVMGCTNNQRKRKLLMSEICAAHRWKRSTCMHGVYRLHRFPAVPEKCWEWEIALNCKNFKPSKLVSASVDPLDYEHAANIPSATYAVALFRLSQVCSTRFVDGKPTINK